MKNLFLLLVLIAFSNRLFSQGITLENEQKIVLKKNDATDDGTFIKRNISNALQIQYFTGSLEILSGSNQPLQLKNATNAVRAQIHPNGLSFFYGSLGVNTGSTKYKFDVANTGSYVFSLGAISSGNNLAIDIASGLPIS